MLLFSGIPYLRVGLQDGSSGALSILPELLTASGFRLIKIRANPNSHRCDHIAQPAAKSLLCKRTGAGGGNPMGPGVQTIIKPHQGQDACPVL